MGKLFTSINGVGSIEFNYHFSTRKNDNKEKFISRIKNENIEKIIEDLYNWQQYVEFLSKGISYINQEKSEQYVKLTEEMQKYKNLYECRNNAIKEIVIRYKEFNENFCEEYIEQIETINVLDFYTAPIESGFSSDTLFCITTDGEEIKYENVIEAKMISPEQINIICESNDDEDNK